MIERRFFRGQVRAKDGDRPGLAGTAAVYNQEYDNGWFVETISPGAFDGVLQSSPDVRGLFNHNPDNLLARTKNGTLRLADSSAGLGYEMDLDDTGIARDVHRMVQRGDVDGCSFSFEVGDDKWETERDDTGRVIRERRTIMRFARVDDVGPVTFPAYEGTKVAARSLWPAGVPAEIRSRVPELRADDEKKTKRVDGEDLPASSFLIVGDEEDTSTWKLPWKFSTDAKTKSHLRNALARFDQLEGVSDEEKAKAWKKLIRLCEKNGIDVSDEDKKKYSRRAVDPDGDGDDDTDLVDAMENVCSRCSDFGEAMEGARSKFGGADGHDAIRSAMQCGKEMRGLIGEFLPLAEQELGEDDGGEDGTEQDSERARRLRLAEATL